MHCSATRAGFKYHQSSEREGGKGAHFVGPQWGLLFVKEWGEPESRGRWAGDDDRAKADQVPFKGSFNGAGRATRAARWV